MRLAPPKNCVIGRALALGLCLMCSACDRTDEIVSTSKQDVPTAGKMVRLDRSPRDIVLQCLRRYRTASRYSDAAFVRLRYTLRGSLVEDRAPVKVSFDRRRGVGLEVYSVRAGMKAIGDDAILQVSVEGKPEIQNQILCQPAPQDVTAQWLQSDPILTSHLSAGLAGFPVQLDMLLGSESLEKTFDDRSKFTLHSTQEVDARRCAVIAVETPAALKFLLWIDLDDSVLRRIKYPAEALPPEMSSDSRVSDIQLTVEFADAQLDQSVNLAKSTPSVGIDGLFVNRFVPKPPAIEDGMLGETVPAFDLLAPDGEVLLATSDARRQGKSLVLLWLANHPASRAAAEQMAEIETKVQKVSPELARKVQFVSIWAEPDTPGGQTFDQLAQSWSMPGVLAVDRRAMGRDVFGIAEAPTLIVLDARGRIQLRSVRANPKLTESLPPLLFALAEDRNIAGETIAAAQEAYRQFEQQLKAATLDSP